MDVNCDINNKCNILVSASCIYTVVAIEFLSLLIEKQTKNKITLKKKKLFIPNEF